MQERQENSSPPGNIEAEQQLLGALFCRPDAHVSLSQEDFYDPVHGAIYARMMHLKSEGKTPSPVSMRSWAEQHDGLKELGGPKYLARLMGASIGASSAADYANMIREERQRRDIVHVLEGAVSDIRSQERDLGGIIAGVEMSLMGTDAPSRARPVTMMAAVTKAMESSFAAFSGDERGMVRSGIDRLDHIIGGFYPGEMTLLGGRPSMGKTALALSIALNVARDGHGVAIASLEMTPEAMATRAISEATTYSRGGAVTYSDIRTGKLDATSGEIVKTAAQGVAHLPIAFLPQDFEDVADLTSGVRQIAKGPNGLKFVVVDYAQLLKAKGHNRYEQITEISRSLKRLARICEVPVLALSQLSRQVESREDKRPMLSDLRESGQLEQDADAVMFCYRDEYYLQREEPDSTDLDKFEVWQGAMSRAKNRLEIIVSKQRQGAIGTAHVFCNPSLNKVWE